MSRKKILFLYFLFTLFLSVFFLFLLPKTTLIGSNCRTLSERLKGGKEEKGEKISFVSSHCKVWGREKGLLLFLFPFLIFVQTLHCLEMAILSSSSSNPLLSIISGVFEQRAKRRVSVGFERARNRSSKERDTGFSFRVVGGGTTDERRKGRNMKCA